MSHDCATVIDLWTNWGKATTVDRNSPTACCSKLYDYDLDPINPAVVQSPDIPSVYCTLDGIVTQILWYSQSLSGSIPESIGNLKYLKTL
jgi:hypothetical protein